jgi:hypothetical protein
MKSMLIIDTPKSCSECKLSIKYPKGIYTGKMQVYECMGIVQDILGSFKAYKILRLPKEQYKARVHNLCPLIKRRNYE